MVNIIAGARYSFCAKTIACHCLMFCGALSSGLTLKFPSRLFREVISLGIVLYNNTIELSVTVFTLPISSACKTRMPPIGVTIIVAAFHAGAYRERVRNGPHYLLNNQLVEHLMDEGIVDQDIEVLEIGRVDSFEGEFGRSFEVKRRIAEAVKNAIEHNRFPLVLAGNCNATVGVNAGLPDQPTDIVWFDAHPDFNTLDEVTGGYFDGMGVATLVGQAWKSLARSIPGFRP